MITRPYTGPFFTNADRQVMLRNWMRRLDTETLVKEAINNVEIAMYLLQHLHQENFEQKLGGFNGLGLMHFYAYSDMRESGTRSDVILNRLSGAYYAQLADAHSTAKDFILKKLKHKLHPESLKRLQPEMEQESVEVNLHALRLSRQS